MIMVHGKRSKDFLIKENLLNASQTITAGFLSVHMASNAELGLRCF